MAFKIPIMGTDYKKWLSTVSSVWASSNLILSTILNIDSWDMQATASKTITLPSFLNYKRIIQTGVLIKNDDDTKRYDATFTDGFTDVEINATTVIITRKASGFFDTTDFNDSGLLIRGHLTLWYQV